MPTKAQLLELNAEADKKIKALRKELETANSTIKARVKPFNEMKAELAKTKQTLTDARSQLRHRMDDIKTLKEDKGELETQLGVAKADATRYFKRIPWYRSKK